MVRCFKLVLTGLFLTFFLVVVKNCGLPKSAYVTVNDLNKPHVEIYNRGNILYFEITGYYPPDEYPNFLGYNIYVGDNNNSDKVIDRVMYISDENSLPSYNVSTSDATKKITISLDKSLDKGEIRFRYSRHATSDDVPEGHDRTALFSKPLVIGEQYYFVVEPVEENRTGIRTEAIKHVFIHYATDQQWDYTSTLTGVGFFNDMTANSGFFVLPTTDGLTYGVGSGGGVDSVYQTIPESDSSYSDSPYQPYREHIYFFRATESSSGVKQYLSIWVKSVTDNGLIIDYAHYKVSLPDFINGVTQIR